MKAKNFLSTPVLSVFEVLTLFVCSWSLHGHACDIDASFIVLYGSYLSGFNFWSLNVSDIGACARACMRMTLCLSFNVDLHAGACDLNSDLLENWSGSQIKQRSRVYSRKKDWPRELDQACYGHSCAIDELCVPGRGSMCSYSCMPIKLRCPRWSNGIVTPRTIGAVAVCPKGYKGNSAICQTNLRWNDTLECVEILDGFCSDDTDCQAIAAKCITQHCICPPTWWYSYRTGSCVDTRQCWSTGHPYTGSTSVTKGGIQCQRWDSKYPHSHIFDEDELYPFDGTTTAAENYCRDPDYSSIPWCYTVDIGKRWDFCDIPLCDDEEYLLVFRGFSGISNGPSDNIADIYNAWESGAGTSDFICSTNCSAHYRLLVLKYWDHFGHSKVKVSLHAKGVEKQFLIFNGTKSTLTNWFSSGRLLNSSWKNLASHTYQDFSLNGDGYRHRFVINIDDTSCDDWQGFLTILINDTCAFNSSMKYPKILYSDSIDQPAFWNIDDVEGVLHQADYLDISTTIN